MFERFVFFLGFDLVEYIIQKGLELHNLGKEYTYDCSTGKSVIDLTLSWNLKTGLKGWKVSKGLNHSDHNTIKYTIETELKTIPIHAMKQGKLETLQR